MFVMQNILKIKNQTIENFLSNQGNNGPEKVIGLFLFKKAGRGSGSSKTGNKNNLHEANFSTDKFYGSKSKSLMLYNKSSMQVAETSKHASGNRFTR